MPSAIDVARRIALYSGAGTVGSLFIAYGLREFLRASGGGYYCCNLAQHQGNGIVLTFIGWVFLIIAGANFYRDLASE